MNALRQALADYLAVRRILGFKLRDSERLLTQFIACLENRGEEHVTIEAAVAWTTLPAQRHRRWLSARLTVVRRFGTTSADLVGGVAWIGSHDLDPRGPGRAASALTAASSDLSIGCDPLDERSGRRFGVVNPVTPSAGTSPET